MDELSRSRMFNRRPMVAIALGLIAGILSAFFTERIGLAIVAGIAMLAVLVFAAGRRWCCVMAGIAALVGILCMSAAMPEMYTDGVYSVEGRVGDISKSNIIISAVRIDGHEFSRKIELNNTFELTADDIDRHVSFVAALDFAKTDDMGYDLHQLGEGIGAKARDVDRFELGDASTTVSGTLIGLKHKVAAEIDMLFDRHAPVVKGILLGDSSYIDNDSLQNIRTAGIAHIFALSGLHISIIISFIGTCIKNLRSSVRLTIIIGFLMLYCALVGFPASLVRAAIMNICIQCAKPLRRRYDRLSALAFAAIIILVVSPFRLFTAGFVMSFGAMLGIILVEPGLKHLLGTVLHEPVGQSAAMSVAATLGVMPSAAAYFNTFSPYGILVNIVAIPIASLAVVTAFSGLLLGFMFDALSVPFAFITGLALDALELISLGVASMPFSSVYVPAVPIISGIAYFAALFAASEYNMIRPKIRRVQVLTLMLCTVVGCFLL